MKGAALRELSSLFSPVNGNGAAHQPVLNVWMVDNDRLFQEAVAATLVQAGNLLFSGSFVHPEDALLSENAGPAPHVILIDVQQFGSDGIVALRQLGVTFPGVPLIVISGFANEKSFPRRSAPALRVTCSNLPLLTDCPSSSVRSFRVESS